MPISGHKLVDDDGTSCPFISSPNSSALVERRFLVIHYTSGRSAETSIQWLTNRNANASAHLVIGRDGTITQLVRFDRAAWHAGRSRWKDIVGLNRYSIGIELDNAGRLHPQGDHWRAWFGGEYQDHEVIEAVHKNESAPSGWHVFTEPQLQAAVTVSSLLVNKYSLEDILGHDDISPGRKVDPGPAFPMESFRGRVLGRREDEDGLYKTTAELNIRVGPGTEHATIEGSPLPRETEVAVLHHEGSWRFVDVLPVVNGVMDVQGWVHRRFLE